MNAELKKYFSGLLQDRIQQLYDDPYAQDDESLRELHDEVTLMQAAANELDINYQKIVGEETSSYEQARMNVLLKHSSWKDSIWDEIDEAEAELD